MLLLVVLAVAATVNVVRSRGGPATLPPGPGRTNATVPDTAETTPEKTVTEGELPAILPLPGELREEGGILWWSDEDCRAGSADLGSGSVEPLSAEHCRLWPAPDGAHAVAVAANRADGLEGRGLVLFEGRGGLGTVVRHEPGFLASELAWAPDGQTFAACLGTGKGATLDVRPLEGAGLHGEGLCFPAWAGGRGLAAVELRPLSVTLAGEPVLDRDAMAELLPSVPSQAHREVSALAGGTDGQLAVALVAVSDTRLLPFLGVLVVVSREGSIELAAELAEGVLPTAVGFAPDGSALWYLDAGTGAARVISIPSGGPAEVPEARWLAWSPSGRYLAAATEEGLVVSSWPGLERIAVIPVVANDISWTRSPS